MKVTDKVKLKFIPDDLRYDVDINTIGEIVNIDKSRGDFGIFVKWYKGESPMSHKEHELEILTYSHD